MGIGSLGMTELVVIFVIVLVAFGPRRFPEIARSMGSAMREFRRSLNQIQRELEEVDIRKDLPGKDILDDIRSGKPGNWLDPNKTSVPTATPGARSVPEAPGPEVTGEAAGAEPDGYIEQLPMFDGSAADASSPASAEEEPEVIDPVVDPAVDPPTEDSRSD